MENLEAALEGVKASIEAGFCPVKLNMVVLKDVNVGDVPELIEYAGKNNIVLQLIELDPVNVGDNYYKNTTEVSTNKKLCSRKSRLNRKTSLDA